MNIHFPCSDWLLKLRTSCDIHWFANKNGCMCEKSPFQLSFKQINLCFCCWLFTGLVLKQLFTRVTGIKPSSFIHHNFREKSCQFWFPRTGYLPFLVRAGINLVSSNSSAGPLYTVKGCFPSGLRLNRRLTPSLMQRSHMKNKAIYIKNTNA